ncbi:tetratricopeptide repeat protein [Anditalea andensis]|nr:tetratricopeptide repeat protein [Anditalea andensis]
MNNLFLILLLVLSLASCQKGNISLIEEELAGTPVFQALSLTNDSLFTTVDSAAMSVQIDELNKAIADYKDTATLENIIWKGRREAYIGRYDLAIATFTEAISRFPNSYEALRHRGHRYITIRQFDKAIEDLQKASSLMKGEPRQIELDGIPNDQNIPLTTVQFNVWYHLGLAHYLEGNFENALEAYRTCLEVSDNDDLIVATLDWKYMTLMKMGRESEAKELLDMVAEDMTIIENEAYHNRLLMYKGLLQPEELIDEDFDSELGRLQYVTQGYGLGNYYLGQNQVQPATETFLKVMKTNYWAAFGYIASEMELAILKDE